MIQKGLFDETERLFERLCEIPTLRQGFAAVKANDGSPGIDGVSVKEYEARLEEELAHLKAELVGWSYKPRPVRRVEIPKPGGKGARIRHDPIPESTRHTGSAHRWRVRVQLVRNMKRRRTIAANFRKHGIGRETALRTAYSHRSWWALSHTWAVKHMFPNQWFEEHGLFIKSTERLPHWFEIRRLISIP